MSKVAVVAHARKSLGGGPPGLRQVLAREGVTDPLWHQVRKSRKASKYARRATAEGADRRTLGRVAVSGAELSPFVEMTAGKAFRIRFDRKLPYELDGGARPAVRDLRIKVRPRSVTLCVLASEDLWAGRQAWERTPSSSRA